MCYLLQAKGKSGAAQSDSDDKFSSSEVWATFLHLPIVVLFSGQIFIDLMLDKALELTVNRLDKNKGNEYQQHRDIFEQSLTLKCMSCKAMVCNRNQNWQ